MPYIPITRRELLDEYLLPVSKIVQNEGELNYVITKLLILVYPKADEHYKDHNTVLGLLEAVKAEWIRRRMNDYEETRRHLNGDVYV